MWCQQIRPGIKSLLLPVLLQVAAEKEASTVVQGVVGISFATGVMSSVLPPVASDEGLLPPPYELRVLQQPQKRTKRRVLPNFKLLTLHTPPAVVPPPSDGVNSNSGAAEAAVPALKLDGAVAASLTAVSSPSSRPASSRGDTSSAATDAAIAAEPATPPPAAPVLAKTASTKLTPRSKAAHNKPPPVLEDAIVEPPVDR